MKTSIEKLLGERAPIIDEMIQKFIPRRFERDSVLFALNPPRYGHDLEALDKAVVEPIWEFLDRGGKRWRPALFLLVCEALGEDPEDFLEFAIIPEVIHNGTLVIDDVEDGSEFRRGKPCTHRIFGLDIAINAGNAMYYLPLLTLIKNRERVPAEKLSKVYEIYVREMINLSLGQAMDIAWHRGLANADEVDERRYLQMCAYKTGALARMAGKMAAVLAGAGDNTAERLGRFAESIGVAFQIQDDILDLVGEEFAERKGGRGRDITEGKRTLAVIHTLGKARPDDRGRLIGILSMHTTDQKLVDEAICLIKRYESVEYARGVARSLVEESWKEVDGLLPPSDAKDKLREFSRYLIERKI